MRGSDEEKSVKRKNLLQITFIIFSLYALHANAFIFFGMQSPTPTPTAEVSEETSTSEETPNFEDPLVLKDLAQHLGMVLNTVAVYDEESENKPAVVIAMDELYAHVGFAGDSQPRGSVPLVVGRSSGGSVMVGMGSVDAYVGLAALQRSSKLNLSYPNITGSVSNWTDMKKIYHHIFYNTLRVHPEEHAVIVTDGIEETKENRETLTQVMFEVFNVPSFYISKNEVLSAYSNGKTTALVSTIGVEKSYNVSIYEGYVLPDASNANGLSLSKVNSRFKQLLEESGNQLSGQSVEGSLYGALLKHGFVSLNLENDQAAFEESSSNEVDFTMANGEVITIGTEGFMALESLFQPGLANLSADGLAKGIYESISRADESVQDKLYSNIVLTGPGPLFKNVAPRVQQELQELAPGRNIKITQSSQFPQFSHWIGGSILSSLSTFEEMWITKDEYDENGPGIIHRKAI